MGSIVKVILASLIIFFLIQSGKLDFNFVLDAITKHPLSSLQAYICFISLVLLGSWRWLGLLKLDLNWKDSSLSYWESIKLTYIGLFFNPLLPGAVSGDVVKLYYTYRIRPNLGKGHLFSTIVMDRIFGLGSLLLLFVISFIIGFLTDHVIFQNSNFRKLASFNLLLSIGAAFFFFLIFSNSSFKKNIRNLISNFPIIGKIYEKIESHFLNYQSENTVLMRSLLISLACQFLNTLAFYLISKPFMTVELSFIEILLLLPAGVIVAAIPITPLGIGVGHAFFIYLFGLVGEQNGANFYNLYLMLLITTDIAGVYFYLFGFKNLPKVDLKKVKAFMR